VTAPRVAASNAFHPDFEIAVVFDGDGGLDSVATAGITRTLERAHAGTSSTRPVENPFMPPSPSKVHVRVKV
jgi:hypothetical protein